MIRSLLLSLSITFCLVTPALAQSSQDKELVSRFLKAGPPPCCDRSEPYSDEVAAKPYLAPLLAKALNDPLPEIQKKQTSIIFMLGRMGNPEAFRSLIALYSHDRSTAFRIRLMTSLGACLTELTVDQYLDIVVKDPEILAWLEKITEKACGTEKACWRDFLKSKELERFRERCRQLSQPILG